MSLNAKQFGPSLRGSVKVKCNINKHSDKRPLDLIDIQPSLGCNYGMNKIPIRFVYGTKHSSIRSVRVQVGGGVVVVVKLTRARVQTC
jgi:hypothetical protein